MSGLISQITQLFRGGGTQQQESTTATQDEDMQPTYDTVVETVTDYMEIETVEIPLQLQLLPNKSTSRRRRRQRAAFRAANRSLLGGDDTLTQGQLPRRSRSEGAGVSNERPKHEFFSDAEYPSKPDATYDYSDLEDERRQDMGVDTEEQDEPMEGRGAPKARRRPTPKATRRKQPVQHQQEEEDEDEEEGDEEIEDQGGQQTDNEVDRDILERIANGTATVLELENFARGKVSVRHHGVPHRKNYELGIVRKYLIRKGKLARPEQHGMPYRVIQT